MKIKNNNYNLELLKYKNDCVIIYNFYKKKEFEYLPNKFYWSLRDKIHSLDDKRTSTYVTIPRDEHYNVINPLRFYRRSLVNFLIGNFITSATWCVLLIDLLFFVFFPSKDNALVNIDVMNMMFNIPIIAISMLISFFVNRNFIIGLKYKMKWDKILINYNIIKPKKWIKK
ncbi:MAG: hypothetical protein LBH55_00915 [Mycoplasmataceae bacterium]|jgi:hypothetical protein|nr:hypothetical protein [Mycoplasmataceae bacterium]